MYKLILKDKLDVQLKRKLELIRNDRYYIDGNFYLYTDLISKGESISDDKEKIDRTIKTLKQMNIDVKVIKIGE